MISKNCNLFIQNLALIFGSGALPGKMLLVRIIKNIKILGQVRLIKG